MSENVRLSDLVAYLPANSKQLQARFPQLSPAVIQDLINKGQGQGLVTWDALSSRWKATGKDGADQVAATLQSANVSGKLRRCETCGEEFLPTSNAQKRCDRHAERRIRGSDQGKPPAKPPITQTPRRCEKCGVEFVPSGNRQKFCPEHRWRTIAEQAPVEAPPATTSGAQAPSLPANGPEQAPVSERETVFPVLHLQPRPPLNCHVERGPDGPEFVISQPDVVVALDVGEAVAVMGWLRDSLQAWRERGAS